MKAIGAAAVVGVSLGLWAGTPAMAQDEGEQEVQQAAAQESDENRRICRRVHITGSNIARRYCMTQAEWTELSEATREEAQDVVTDANERGRFNEDSVTDGD